MGLRLLLRQAQAGAGDIVLLYADESEALTHPYLAHAWAERGADLRVRAPGQSKKVAMPDEPLGSTMGALDAATRELVVSTSPTKVSADFIAFLGSRHRTGSWPVLVIMVRVGTGVRAGQGWRGHTSGA